MATKQCNLGKYQIRIDPKYKKKLAYMAAYRRLQGKSDANAYNVTEEAIELFYEKLVKEGMPLNGENREEEVQQKCN